MTKRKAWDDGKSPLKVRKLNDNEINQKEKTSNKNSSSSSKEQYLHEEVKAALQEFVKMNNDNKFTKQFVWTTSAIDLFHFFTKSLAVNYVFVAHALEAITNIYALSVDSLYDDTIRINSALSSKVIRKRYKVKLHEQEVENASKRPARALKTRGTIVKNPESLNQKLHSNALIDPFFNKINKSIGRIGNPDQMLMNILTNRSSLMQPQAKFWISRDFEGIADESTNYARNESLTIRMDTDIQNCSVRPSNVDFDETHENENESDDRQKNLDQLDSDYGIRCDENANNELYESGYGTFTECTQANSQNWQESVDLSDRDEEMVVQQVSVQEQADEGLMSMDTFIEPDHMLPSFIDTQQNIFLHSRSFFLEPPKLAKGPLKRKYAASLAYLKNCENCLLPADEKNTFRVNLFKRSRLISHISDIPANIFDEFLHSSLALSDPIRDIQDCSDCGSHHDEQEYDISDTDRLDDSMITVVPRESFEQVKRIQSSAFTPRSFSMRTIKEISFNIIKHKSKSGQEEVKFSELCLEVAEAFRGSSQSSSCALNFLGILQFVSDSKISLQPDSTIGDFSIKYNYDSK